MSIHRFPYEWTLKDANFKKDKGTVFSCFACGGGSTMGYKLAGFDVIGCNEIDKKMMAAYKANHNPKYSYLEPIQTFKLRKDLPKELYNLDILDGSPPCSSFSMAGNREKDWGKEKKFREGQADQVLDTLFFDFIDLAKELQPKIVIAENVKGLLMGPAKEYVGRIGSAFDKAGYYVEKWLLDASKMGVPQRRERVFFIAIRKDLIGKIDGWTDMFNPMPSLNLDFNEKVIPFKAIERTENKHNDLSDLQLGLWLKCSEGESFSKYHEKGFMFGYTKVSSSKPLPTLTTKGDSLKHYNIPRELNTKEWVLSSTFPTDYKNCHKYILGMSVPPVMTAQISSRIYEQWLSKI